MTQDEPRAHIARADALLEMTPAVATLATAHALTAIAKIMLAEHDILQEQRGQAVMDTPPGDEGGGEPERVRVEEPPLADADRCHIPHPSGGFDCDQPLGHAGLHVNSGVVGAVW